MSKQLEKQILKLKRQIERSTSKELMPLLKAYQDALLKLQGKATQLTNKHVIDGVLSLSDAQRYAIQHELEKDIIEQSNSIGATELAIATGILASSYKSSYYQSFYQLDRGIDISMSFNLLRPEFVEQAIHMPLNGINFSDRIWKNKEGMIRRLRGGLASTLIDGADPKKMARELSKAYGTTAYESSRLVQNEAARATTLASQQVFADSGVVSKVMFNATLDDVTTDTCQELDGTIYDLGDEPQIPDDTHIGCRSVIIPMVEGWNPSVRKDNISKENIAYVTYDKWAASKGIK